MDYGFCDLQISQRHTFVVLFKRKCIQKQPTINYEPKQNIQGCVLNAKTEIPQNIASGMWKTVDACIAEHGEHFQHLLCKSVA
jgi:hypothetical protein